jgi:hypothetical protein
MIGYHTLLSLSELGRRARFPAASSSGLTCWSSRS